MNTMYNNLMSLEREIDRMLGGFTSPAVFAPAREFPVMDVADNGNEMILTFDLPGVHREDLKVTLEKGLLTISGERRKASLPEGAAWIRSEVWDGRFTRSVQLPRQLKSEGINAELKNGILRLVLPKTEEAKPREIAIR